MQELKEKLGIGNEQKFYNEKIKLMYLEEKASLLQPLSISNLVNYFERAKDFEEIADCDLCNFTPNQIINFYKSLSLSSVQTLIVINTQLKNYTLWCMNKNMVITGMNPYEEITRKTLLDCVNSIDKNTRIITRETLESSLQAEISACDKFLLLATFEGIRGSKMKEQTHLRLKDIDKKTLECKLSTGRKVKFSEQLYKYAKESAKETEYITLSAIRKTKPLMECGDMVIKPSINARNDGPVSNHVMIMKMKRLVNFLDLPPNMNLNSLYESGRIDFINRESKKMGLSSKDYLFNYEDMIMQKYPSKIQAKKIYLEEYKDFFE